MTEGHDQKKRGGSVGKWGSKGIKEIRLGPESQLQEKTFGHTLPRWERSEGKRPSIVSGEKV